MTEAGKRSSSLEVKGLRSWGLGLGYLPGCCPGYCRIGMERGWNEVLRSSLKNRVSERVIDESDEEERLWLSLQRTGGQKEGLDTAERESNNLCFQGD